MATNTPNYSLTKPDATDMPDIAVLNGNMDKVDAAIKANATNIGLLQLTWSDASTSDWRVTLENRITDIPLGSNAIVRYTNQTQFYMVFIYRYTDGRAVVRLETGLDTFKAYRNGAGLWSYA